MTCVLWGPRQWSMARDEIGHRTYKITFLIYSDVTDGPYNALNCPGLPLPGSYWAFYGDIDYWATCQWDATVKRHDDKEGDPHKWWVVEQTFSTKPPKLMCKENEVQNPLLEPYQMSVGSQKRTAEAYMDRFGRGIMNSAHEPLKGAAIEFDQATPTVKITQNVASFLQAVTIPEGMLLHLNDSPLWGYPAGTVRLGDVRADEKWYGQCFKYYQRELEFELDGSGWARDILDEGTKVLRGHWGPLGTWILDNINNQPPNRADPSNYIKAVDRSGNPAKLLLNGYGLPAYSVTGTTNRYLSIDNSNTNKTFNQYLYWIPLPVGLQSGNVTADKWDPEHVYLIDDLVFELDTTLDQANLYVCIKDGAVDTSPSSDVALNLGFWRLLKTLPNINALLYALATTFDFPYNDAGTYSAGTTYSKMDVVVDTGLTGVGINHIERYPYANFLLLGIPLVL